MIKLLLILSFIAPLSIICYPLISFIRYKFYRRPIAKSKHFITPVSIIIACYNEEKFIRNKILSFLDKDEWIEGSEIIVVSAGSTDKTNCILLEFENNPNIFIIKSYMQISKIVAVNMAVDKARHSILVFADCRQKMKKHSLKQLVYNFNDADVGTVVSVLEDPNPQRKQSNIRKIINWLVYIDSQSNSGFNVYGALYAQRSSIFCKFPTNLLFDDLFVVVSTLSQKKRLIQEPNAVIYDINFQIYYGGERLERLTRGLLIFLIRQWSLLLKINKSDLLRFLIFKYAKLLLPFSVLIWIGYYITYLFNYGNLFLFNLITFLVLLTITKTRNSLVFYLRINYYFFIGIFKFFFLKKQSLLWEKLKTTDN